MLKKLNDLRDREDGFTLIELLIVIVIIGVLSAIAIPIFLNQQKAATVASVKSDVRNTVSNVALTLVKYPSATSAQVAASTKVQSSGNTITLSGDWSSYTVSGSNSTVTGSYTFNSATGNYTGTGADYV